LPAVRISGLALIIITFGFGQIFSWALGNYSSFTGGDGGLFVAPVTIGGLSTVSVSTRYFFGMAVALVLTVLVGQLRRTPVGRSMRAISHSGLAAQSVGVDVARTKLLAFVLCSVLAGIGGWLFANDLAGTAPGYFDYFQSIFLVAALLIGGLGTLFGAWIGAAYLIFVPQGVQSIGGGNLYTAVSGLVLIAVMLFAPHGLTAVLGRATTAVVERVPRRRSWERAGDAGSTSDGPRVEPWPQSPLGPEARPRDVPAVGASLRVEQVSVGFGHVQALRDVSLVLDATCINGIIGPNGAGKTTLLNVVTGLVKPSHGTVVANGQDMAGLDLRARAALGVGRTFQTPRLLESETVEINILLGRFTQPKATIVGQALSSPAHRRLDRGDRCAVREIADRLGLSAGDLSRQASSLPAGTRRLVEVGRVLAMDPSIILLDEPIAGLDADERHAVAEVLLDYQRASDTLIVVVEHNVEWVRAVCDHLFVLDAGTLLATGAPDDVLNLPTVRSAYFGLAHKVAAATE
jgi:ABC-type branched-subunit amino acid transport system ATPase component